MPRLCEPEIKRHWLHFKLVDCDASTADQLRRYVLGGLETMAINHVAITKNESLSPDEQLARDIGLVPLYCANVSWFESITLAQQRELSHYHARNCARFRISLTAEPGEFVRLTERDYKLYPFPDAPSDVPLVEAVSEDDPLTVVKMTNPTDQPVHIEVIGYAVRGTGRNNVRWKPVAKAAVVPLGTGSYQCKFETIGQYSPRELQQLIIDWLATRS